MTVETVTAIPLGNPLPGTNRATNDTGGYVEGDICALSESLLIFGTLSEDSFALHLQAIDVSGDLPVIGPDTYYFSHGQDWTAPPLADDPLVDDWATLNDFSVLVPLSETTFAVVGTPGEEMAAGGYHVASFYSVDPSSLSITRTAVATHPAGGWFSDEPNAAAWGDKVVVISSEFNAIAIAHPNGAVQLQFPFPQQTSNTSTMSNLTVIGDTAVFFAFTGVHTTTGPDWYAVDLNSGAVTSSGGVPGIGEDDWGMFTTAMPDGRIAYVGSGTDEMQTGPSVNYQFPIHVGILDWRSNSFKSTVIPDAWNDHVGWTGGWYSNIRDINCWPDGSIVVSWAQLNVTPTYAVLNDNLEVLDEVTLSGDFPLKSASTNVLFYRAALPAQGRFAAVWRFPGSNDATYATWFLMAAGGKFGPDMSAVLDRVLQAFQGPHI